MRLSTAIAAADTEADISSAAVGGLRDKALGYDFVALFLVDAATNERVLAASVGWAGLSVGWRVPRGQGLSGRPLTTGKIQYTPDVTKDPEYVPGLGTGSEVDIPLIMDGAPIGVLVVESERPRAFDKKDFEILVAASNQAAIAIARARLVTNQRRLLDEAQHRADEQEALLATLADLSSQLELSRLLQAVLDRAGKLLGTAGGELAIYDETRKELEIVANHGTGNVSVGTRLALGEGAMGEVARTRAPLMIDDYAKWVGRSARYAKISAHAAVVLPLLIGGRLVGVVNFWHTGKIRRFTEADLRLLNLFAPQAAIAIENARLYAAARRQGQYFEELVRNSPVAIVTLDIQHKVIAGNPAFERLYGYTLSEIVGRRLDDLITDEDDPGAGRGVHRAGQLIGPSMASASGGGRTAPWWTSKSPRCR